MALTFGAERSSQAEHSLLHKRIEGQGKTERFSACSCHVLVEIHALKKIMLVLSYSCREDGGFIVNNVSKLMVATT